MHINPALEQCLRIDRHVRRAGDFEASIVLHGDGTVTISAADFSQNFQINWSDDINYFKAGVYVQDGNPTDFPVDYKSLTYSLG